LAVCSLLAAVGVGLIIWGLVGHISTLVIRGVIELVVVVVLFALLRRPTAKTP